MCGRVIHRDDLGILADPHVNIEWLQPPADHIPVRNITVLSQSETQG